MDDISWLQMLAFQQELHHFSRAMLTKGQKRVLTTSELELLSLLYLETEEATPLGLSHRSGMKKEAVSRCLRQLLEKGFVQKERRPEDERSFLLTLTDEGRAALRDCYAPMLQPLYALRRSMGKDFEPLFHLIERANRCMEASGAPVTQIKENEP